MKVIFVRHGRYSISGHLSDEGKSQIKLLADRLKEYVINPSQIYTSVATRALESGYIIGEALGIPIHGSVVLGNFFGDVGEYDDVHKLIKENSQLRTLILVSHQSLVADFSHQYAWREMNLAIDFYIPEPGEALVMDLEARTAVWLI